MSKNWAYTSRKLLEKFARFLEDKEIGSVDDVTPAVREEYKAILLLQMAPVPAQNKFRAISAMFDRAIKLKLVGETPVKSTTPIRGIEKNRLRYLSMRRYYQYSQSKGRDIALHGTRKD